MPRPKRHNQYESIKYIFLQLLTKNNRILVDTYLKEVGLGGGASWMGKLIKEELIAEGAYTRG